jgi:hypothetical protein
MNNYEFPHTKLQQSSSRMAERDCVQFSVRLPNLEPGRFCGFDFVQVSVINMF